MVTFEPVDGSARLPLREAATFGVLAMAFRLAFAWSGAAGYLTADGALSGIVALHARDGVAHHVFVPSVPYSGSLKSHLTAPLAAAMDPARAFALVSLAFYALFAGAVFILARLADPIHPERARVAGLWAVFAPAFVTRYSLSNDGNYVEVLALGAVAFVLAVLWARDADHGRGRAFLLGLALGLGFWCHILAIIPLAVVALYLMAARGRAATAALVPLAAGWILGYAPGLLWNARHGWESFLYVIPGGQPVGAVASGPPAFERLWANLTTGLPILVGYDRGLPAAWRALALAAAVLGLSVLGLELVRAARRGLRDRRSADALVTIAVFVQLAIVVAWLPALPGNPRYLLFLFTPLALLLARSMEHRLGVWAAVALTLLGLFGSLGQAREALDADRGWRRLVADLEGAGVRRCYTDFFIAARINFLSEERIVCSSALGPTTTEYFPEYAPLVEAAPRPAVVAVNRHSGDRIARRLAALGVSHRRIDSSKPVFTDMSRKVRPAELFPGRFNPSREPGPEGDDRDREPAVR